MPHWDNVVQGPEQSERQVVVFWRMDASSQFLKRESTVVYEAQVVDLVVLDWLEWFPIHTAKDRWVETFAVVAAAE